MASCLHFASGLVYTSWLAAVNNYAITEVGLASIPKLPIQFPNAHACEGGV